MTAANPSLSTEQSPVWWERISTKLGFHTPMLAFAVRTAFAAFVALVLAHAMGLQHPHWAAMSVWASSQPMREHLLSRGIYRFGGSVVGVVYAVALVLLARNSLWVLAIGLALWGALCAFLGNLQRGYMVYGCMLAGYSAAMVVLMHHGPYQEVWPLAWDRMFTVITGVATALGISWCFAPRRKAAVLIAQSRQALAGVLQATSTYLREPAQQELKAQQSVETNAEGDDTYLLSQLAAVEEMLEVYPEGSSTARNTSKAMHWQQHYALELVYQLTQASRVKHVAMAGQQNAVLADALDALVQALLQPPQVLGEGQQHLHQVLRQAIRVCEDAVAALQEQGVAVQPGLNALYLLLQEMRRGLQAEAVDLKVQGLSSKAKGVIDPRSDPLPLHRDWVGAKEAAVRAGGTLLLFGMVWAWTGSNIVGFGMLGLAIMLLVFSAFESPGRTMTYVLRGQIIGAGLALLCQTLVWPLAQSSWEMVWLTLPFAIIGGLVFAYKRTAAGAMDTNMAMFILLAPSFPDTAGFGQHLSFALAVVSGPALAWVVYRWVYPTNGPRRMQTLAKMMADEVPALGRRLLDEGKPSLWSLWPAVTGQQWQAQLYHRLLRLVRWADKTKFAHRTQLSRMGLSLRAMQVAMQQLQQWRRTTILATPALRRTERLAELALRRTVSWGEQQTPEASRKAQAAWQALAQQPNLPPTLVAQALHVAQYDIAAMDTARRVLYAP